MASSLLLPALALVSVAIASPPGYGKHHNSSEPYGSCAPSTAPSTDIDRALNMLSRQDHILQRVVIHCRDEHALRHTSSFSIKCNDKLRTSLQRSLILAASKCDLHFLLLEQECHCSC
jgi:hypothetical protein